MAVRNTWFPGEKSRTDFWYTGKMVTVRRTRIRVSAYVRGIMVCCVCMAFLSCSTHSVNAEKPHHTDNGFTNDHLKEEKGFFSFLKWRWQRWGKDIPSEEDYDFPLAENDPAFLRANREKITLTWIGHATLFLQIGGKNILTDPHFSERASPVQWAGPKRVVPPGIPLGELPPIDIVVISHDHYDSLDEDTIEKLRQRTGGEKTRFYVPLGFRPWLNDRGVTRVIELDWWDDARDDDLTITAVPMQHWSKRSIFGKNNTLWAGWAISTKEFRFFFAGDSGYGSHFQDLGQRLGPFDLAAIPIGAYEPRWFMKDHHMNPEEAVQVHIDTGSKKSVAMHWGTFILTDEPLDEPPRRLEAAKNDKGLTSDAFIVLHHGETMIIQ